jgi:AbrB family looped-hinge helix DNA binding protein
MPSPAELKETQRISFVVPKPRVEAKAVIGDKGRIVVPANIREALGLKPGDSVVMYVEDHALHLSTRENFLKRTQDRAQRFFAPGRSLADELIAERRAEASKEASEG